MKRKPKVGQIWCYTEKDYYIIVGKRGIWYELRQITHDMKRAESTIVYGNDWKYIQ